MRSQHRRTGSGQGASNLARVHYSRSGTLILSLLCCIARFSGYSSSVLIHCGQSSKISFMEILGCVLNGVVIPEGQAALPEGAIVRILYEPEFVPRPTKESGRHVTLPLFESEEPGSLHLTNEMIAEILDEDELSA
jgi:hypothetical protein